MKVITFNKRVIIQRPNEAHQIVCNPGTRYLIEDKLFLDLCQSPETGDRIHRFSDGPAFTGPSYFGTKVLFSRLRGIGDELAMTGVVQYFNDVSGDECSVLATSGREPVWRHNPCVKSLLSEPLALDAIWRSEGRPHFDRMFAMESLIENNQEPDQENIYDMMLRFCGEDPGSIPVEYKRPYIYLTEEEKNFDQRSDYIVYQLHASNATRSIPESKSRDVLQSIDAWNKFPVFVLSTDMSDETRDFIDFECQHVYRVTCSDTRAYFACINSSSMVIGPDSSAIHVAAAFNKPAIGFWGPFSPDCRAKYYPNHHAIWDQKACKHAPCFPPSKDLPLNLCPKGKDQKSCEVFESITGERVLAMVKETLG